MYSPERLVISGTEHLVVSHNKPSGNRRRYDIRLGPREIAVPLPLQLFYLIGSLAMLRDTGQESSLDEGCGNGFIHRDRLGLSKSLTDRYIYGCRNEIRQQLQRVGQTKNWVDCHQLLTWPIFESGASRGLRSHWRCVVAPEAVVVNPIVLQFPSSTFRRIAADYFQRHPVLQAVRS